MAENCPINDWDRYLHTMRLESYGYTNVTVHKFARAVDPSTMIPISLYIWECDGSDGLREDAFKDEPDELWFLQRNNNGNA